MTKWNEVGVLMRRAFVPPADTLIAFECAARHLSFTRAAEELHLTQGAVSKQVRQLEDRLGVELFRRVRQRIVLTDAGRLYLHDIRGALEQMTAATRQVMSYAGSADVLNLAVLPTFGTRWLAPRLAEFGRRYPDAGLNLSVRLQPFDFDEEPLTAPFTMATRSGPARLPSVFSTRRSFRSPRACSGTATRSASRRILHACPDCSWQHGPWPGGNGSTAPVSRPMPPSRARVSSSS